VKIVAELEENETVVATVFEGLPFNLTAGEIDRRIRSACRDRNSERSSRRPTTRRPSTAVTTEGD
jgi:hypothetical protein